MADTAENATATKLFLIGTKASFYIQPNGGYASTRFSNAQIHNYKIDLSCRKSTSQNQKMFAFRSQKRQKSMMRNTGFRRTESCKIITQNLVNKRLQKNVRHKHTHVLPAPVPGPPFFSEKKNRRC
jgi:hypothetical protein